MERSSIPRNTLKDLEEFRKRKLAERETAHGMSSSGRSSEFSGVPSQSGSPHQKSHLGLNVEPVPPKPERNQEIPNGNQHSSVFSRISSWLYDTVMPENVTERTVIPEPADIGSNESDEEDAEDPPQPSPMNKSWSAWIKEFLQSYGLWWILAWLCGFLLAVRFGWGAVYFALSVLVIIWKGLSDSRKRKRGALSAYSVFNPNCERIEGTIDAEQLQRQMFLRF